MKFSSKVLKCGLSPMRKFHPYAVAAEAKGRKIYHLNIGQPDIETPKAYFDAVKHFDLPVLAYAPSPGIPELIEAIRKYYADLGMHFDAGDILITNGGSEALQITMNCILDDGDEILVPAPDYPLWTASITLAGGKAVHYLCDEQQDWYPDINDLRSKVTPRTKGIVVINPNNPTGALYPKEILEQIVQVARENDLILFADEIYDRLVMQGEPEHIALASLAPDLLTLCFNGLSKSHRVAGFRVGWVCLAGDKSHAKGYIEGLNLLAKMRLCSNVPAQSIIQTSLGGYQSVDEYLCPGGRLYEQRELIWKTLNSIPGLSAAKPKAAFYIFPKVDTKKFNIHSDEQMALDLLKEQKILITAGTGFNWGEPDHFRIVYLPDLVSLKEASVRLEKFFGSYRQKD